MYVCALYLPSCNMFLVVWEWEIQELLVIAQHHLVLGIPVFESSVFQVT